MLTKLPACGVMKGSDIKNRVDSLIDSEILYAGIEELPQIDGVTLNVKGFYVGSDVGGGQFYYDPLRSKADHNGGTVIAPEAIAAWDGTSGDIATLLNWIGAGAGCFVKIVCGKVDLSEFGASYNQSLDHALIAQSAANTLLPVVVSGKISLSENVNFYNDLIFTDTGELVVGSEATKLITLTTQQVGTTVDPLTVTGLSELSYSVGGFGPVAAGDFAVIDSDEELIKRSTGGHYTKDELIVFKNSSGGLSVGVMENHDLGQIASITKFKAEKPINAKINVSKSSGSVDINGLVTVYRRSVNIKINCNVENDGANLRIEECPSVSIKSPVISGSTSGLGYGVLGLKTGSILIENPNITNCRHGYSGRHDKNVTITGAGWIANDVDSHYGYNMNICNGVTIVGDVSFAGRDVRVCGINHVPENYGIEARPDTPEIKGIAHYKGNSVIINTGNDYSAIVIGTGATSFFDYGRSLSSPASIDVSGNNFDAVSIGVNFRHVWQRQPQNYTRSNPKNINISNNSFSSVNPNYIQGLADFTKSDKITSTHDTSVNICGEESIVNNVDDLYLGSDLSWGYKLSCDRIKNLVNRIDSGAFSGGIVTNCHISNLRNKTTSLTGVTASIGFWSFDNCTFSTTAFDSAQNQRHIAFGKCRIQLMPDDSVIEFKPVTGRQTGLITIIRQSDGNKSGAFTFDCVSPTSSKMVKFGLSPAIQTVDNTTLTGTTGNDGDVTISCNDGSIYLENRSGNSNIFYSIDVF